MCIFGALDLTMTRMQYMLSGSRNGRDSCSHAVAHVGVGEAVKDAHDVPAPAVKDWPTCSDGTKKRIKEEEIVASMRGA